ncbi:SpoIIE family protein phosphatase [Streptomyces griseoaurantiacus]|uniref:SpoIIE family protein phosphatase n=1 Tax=Streptomyces griseoaurantiacus TaxID=68213 RepID=UPI003243EF97
MNDTTDADSGDTPGDRARHGVPLDGALERLGTAALVLDQGGLVVAANEEARGLLDRGLEDLLGQDFHDMLHRDENGNPVPRLRCPMRNAVLRKDTRRGDAEWFARGDGTLFQSCWLVTPYASDENTAGALVLLYESPQPDEPQPGEDEHSTGLTELDRLALLAETTTQLTSTLDVDEALHRLAALTIPRLADWAVVDLLMERDEVRRALVVEHKGGILVERDDLQGPMPPVTADSPMPLSRALRGTASSLAGPSTYQGPPDSGLAVEQQRLFTATGMHSAAIAPIRGLRDVLGALTLGRAPHRDPFTLADLPLLEDLTRRTGLALDNARLYQRQRKVAETMQRHLLPQLPTVRGLEMTARYLPSPDASSVGGDWYDAFTLSDDSHALVIGDVVGHDLDAAAGMAQVRNMLRAFVWSRPTAAPSAVVTQLDEAVMHIAEVPMVTMILGRLTLGDDGLWHLHWTNAGHPPPLLVTHDGQVQYLNDAHGMLLGTEVDRPRPHAVTVLPPRSTLLFYTDGLVESPHRPIDHGLSRLCRHAASLAHRNLDSLCDALLERVRPDDNDDDVAMLALRTPFSTKT